MAIMEFEMSKAPSRSQDQFIVRLPDGMRDRIKAAAEANNRSMNAEIVATLEERYPSNFYLAMAENALISLRVELLSDEPNIPKLLETLEELEIDLGEFKNQIVRGIRD